MNINCPRDPLTCKCDYHLGFDAALDRAFSPPPLGTTGNVERDGERLRVALHLPEPWTPRDPAQPVETFRMKYRRPDPERGACRVRWALRIAMTTAGVFVMYCEGRHQPAPGVGFAIALALLFGAALIGGSKR